MFRLKFSAIKNVKMHKNIGENIVVPVHDLKTRGSVGTAPLILALALDGGELSAS
jgi:hypothetical protein